MQAETRDRLWAVALVAIVVGTTASGARAQDPDDAPPESGGEAGAGEAGGEEAAADREERTAVERARSHMERGQALYLQAHYEEAVTEFEAAYQAQPFSAFLFNAGVALERAGQSGRAADFFERYVGRDPDANDTAPVRERIARLRAAVAAATAAATAATQAGEPTPEVAAAPPPDAVSEEFKSLLSVRTNPEGATIIVRRGTDEVARGPGPFAHTLDSGRYLMVIEHPDYQTVEQEIRVDPGKVYVVIVEMSQGQFLGYLRIGSNVAGAQVYIDDREQGPRGQTPFEAPIPVGTHTVWVERPGYELQQSEMEVGVGEDVTVHVELTRVDFGRLRVIANVAGARVIVDDRQLGTVPFEGQVSAGPHRVRVESDGMKSFEADIEISNGQLTPVRATLRPDVGRAGAYVSAVFAGLFVGAGIALGIVSDDTFNSLTLDQEMGRLASDDPRLDEGLFYRIGADAGFGLGLILGALALYYFVYDPLPPSEGRVLEARDWAFLPMVDPVNGAAGLGFEGRL